MANNAIGDPAMTTMSFNQGDTFFSNARAPRTTFAARLASLQARQEQAMDHINIAGVAARGALALVPFLALAGMFVAL